MSTASTSQATFQKGDRVAFRFGNRNVRGYILEYRGPLGVKGRHIYRVRLPIDPYDPMEFELPEDEMHLDTQVDDPLTKDQIEQYLVNGGLLLMLGAGSDGSTPRAWLRRDTLGNVTHTFVEDRGMVGGAAIPARAESNGKVFTPARDKVVQFVRSFALSEQDAQKIIDRIGTHP